MLGSNRSQQVDKDTRQTDGRELVKFHKVVFEEKVNMIENVKTEDFGSEKEEVFTNNNSKDIRINTTEFKEVTKNNRRLKKVVAEVRKKKPPDVEKIIFKVEENEEIIFEEKKE